MTDGEMIICEGVRGQVDEVNVILKDYLVVT
eukprot:SAG31_NODE_44272_length_263_cov_0.945122_1_plen_30_part_10